MAMASNLTELGNTNSQPTTRRDPRQGRARVPRAEMPVRLSQGALSRHRQERGPGVLALGARQPVPRAADAGSGLSANGAKPVEEPRIAEPNDRHLGSCAVRTLASKLPMQVVQRFPSVHSMRGSAHAYEFENNHHH